MLKVYKKSDWIKLIKRNLNKLQPYQKGQVPELVIPCENLIVTIKTKGHYRNYTFGALSATVDIFSEEEYLYVSYFNGKSGSVKWDNIKSIAFCHISRIK